jgi:ABC-type enterobactin transport system permease subunit
MPILNPMVWLFFLGVCAITLIAATPISAIALFAARAWRNRSRKKEAIPSALPAAAAVGAFLLVIAVVCQLTSKIPLD